ncbi:uncharacterized protein LOC119228129 isoform X2 [Pungitius pungitius]|uniref:uncharacterized protein LOC119228129 isoform X2 n=1 Tax=Pungitius pungitius TaxID=134920 RepID=UPI002E14648B
MTSPDHRNTRVPNNVDQLAFKYMLCKVESSTDSESEISPRWSDTSAMGCVSSTPERGTLTRTLRLTHKPVGRHGCYSLFLDPYDGSSEDSDESKDVGCSSRQTRQRGKVDGGESGCRLPGRNRRFILHPASVAMRESVTEQQQQQHLLDVQMKCGSDSELRVLDIINSHGERDCCRKLTAENANDSTMQSQTMDTEMHCPFNDSGLHTTKSSTSCLSGAGTPVERGLSQRLESSSETSPCPSNPRSVYKRKLGFPEEERAELGQRKRQCVVNMD